MPSTAANNRSAHVGYLNYRSVLAAMEVRSLGRRENSRRDSGVSAIAGLADKVATCSLLTAGIDAKDFDRDLFFLFRSF